jgi:hypothetical protein
MCSIRLNLPMVCSAAADDDGDAPDRRGAYGLLDGVAMMAALADQRVPVALGMPNFQLPAQMRIQSRRQVVTHGPVSALRGVQVVVGAMRCWTSAGRRGGRDAAVANRLRRRCRGTWKGRRIRRVFAEQLAGRRVPNVRLSWGLEACWGIDGGTNAGS